MDTKNNPLDSLPQNEWDAFILSILKPFFFACSKDALVSPEDLQQEAWIGLLAAAKRYDHTRAKFVTYAHHYIRGHVMRYIAKRTKNKPTQVVGDPTELDERQHIESVAETRDLMSIILDSVSDQKHADLLVQHFVHGKSFRSLAKEYGVSHEIIATRTHKLLDLLQIRLNHENA